MAVVVAKYSLLIEVALEVTQQELGRRVTRHVHASLTQCFPYPPPPPQPPPSPPHRFIDSVGISLWRLVQLRSECHVFHRSDLIEAHNTAGDGATFTLAHNEFSHLSWDEFKGSVSVTFVVRCSRINCRVHTRAGGGG